MSEKSKVELEMAKKGKLSVLQKKLIAREIQYRRLFRKVAYLEKRLSLKEINQLSERDKLQAKLSNAIIMAHLGPWEYDVANDLFHFNDHFYKMFRTTAEQVGGYTMKSAEYAKRFVHSEEMDIVREETRKAIETKDPDYKRQIEHRIIYGDGTVGYIKVRIFIKKDEHGRTVKTYGINQDITEQKKSEKILKQHAAELETRNKEIRELAHQTIQAMENDRKALAKEVHDSIGGTLAAIKYQLEERVENKGSFTPSTQFPLEKIIAYIENAIQESRRITKQLRPSVLDDFGLIAAINEHIRDFQQFHPEIRIIKKFEIIEEEINNDVKTILYRVLQESLNNVGKHSMADEVKIGLFRFKKWVKLQVKDNGVGFDAQQVLNSSNFTGGYGLHSMKERVGICEGIFLVESERGKGTNISAYLQIK